MDSEDIVAARDHGDQKLLQDDDYYENNINKTDLQERTSAGNEFNHKSDKDYT